MHLKIAVTQHGEETVKRVSIRENIARHQHRYRRASRSDKNSILDEVAPIPANIASLHRDCYTAADDSLGVGDRARMTSQVWLPTWRTYLKTTVPQT